MKSVTRKFARSLEQFYRGLRPRRSVKIGGKRYALPRGSGTLLALDTDHEPWLDGVYEAAFQIKTGTIVDVGVNQGQTLAKVLRMALGNRYIGLEPQPGCVYSVEEFVMLNGLKNCTIIPVGLSDHTGLAELSLHSFAPGDSTASIAKAHRPESFYVQSKVIPVFPGDDILSLFPNESISLIKIDVEGAELEVLKGLSGTLAKNRPFVMFEVLNNYMVATRENLSKEMESHRNDRARQISMYFESAGYTVFNIRGEALIRTRVITPKVSADLSITDYLAVPHELVPDIESRFEVRETEGAGGS